jgi:hypothetical protein
MQIFSTGSALRPVEPTSSIQTSSSGSIDGRPVDVNRVAMASTRSTVTFKQPNWGKSGLRRHRGAPAREGPIFPGGILPFTA